MSLLDRIFRKKKNPTVELAGREQRSALPPPVLAPQFRPADDDDGLGPYKGGVEVFEWPDPSFLGKTPKKGQP